MDVEAQQRAAMEAMYEAGQRLSESLAEMQRRFGGRLGVAFDQHQQEWRRACEAYRDTNSVWAHPPPEYTVLNQNDKPVTGSSLLELADNVFTVTYAESGIFDVREACDEVYAVKLTPDQLIALGEEIRGLGVQSLHRDGLAGG